MDIGENWPITRDDCSFLDESDITILLDPDDGTRSSEHVRVFLFPYMQSGWIGIQMYVPVPLYFWLYHFFFVHSYFFLCMFHFFPRKHNKVWFNRWKYSPNPAQLSAASEAVRESCGILDILQYTLSSRKFPRLLYKKNFKFPCLNFLIKIIKIFCIYCIYIIYSYFYPYQGRMSLIKMPHMSLSSWLFCSLRIAWPFLRIPY